MHWKNPKKEIETIKERNIILKLSDADCERIYNLCGSHDITVSDLLESFIGDLVDGTYTNGSDERLYANRYFERCGFGMPYRTNLLKYLLSEGYDVYDDFLEVIDDIQTAYADLEDYRKDPTIYDEEEIEFIKLDIEDWENQIKEIKTDFLKNNEKVDWDKEVENVNQWWKQKERFINGNFKDTVDSTELVNELER